MFRDNARSKIYQISLTEVKNCQIVEIRLINMKIKGTGGGNAFSRSHGDRIDLKIGTHVHIRNVYDTMRPDF